MNLTLNQQGLQGVPLWRLQKKEEAAACELVRIPVGYEAHFRLNGQFLYSYQFATLDEALEWAFAKRVEYVRSGWYFIPSTLPVAS